MKAAPTTALALRIGALFHRRPATQWAEKEIRQYKVLVRAKCFEALEDLTLVEQYYAFERKRGDNGKHRRDLYTFLNNFQGEVDRANLWRDAHPVKAAPRKIIPLPLMSSEPFVAPTDTESLASLARFEAERQRRKLERQGCDHRSLGLNG